MDTTKERVEFIENMTWDELVAEENRAYDIKVLRAENDGLKAQLTKTEKALKETKIDLQDKEISFSAVMAILKYYLDFFEALNPSQKALGNAMKKMKTSK